MTPSELLSAAADRIRDLAAAATPGDWTATDLTDDGHPGVWWVDCDHSDGQGRMLSTIADFDRKGGDAAWVAALSPAVAPMIEFWLRETATYFAEFGEYWVTVPEQAQQALALARALCPDLIGETP